MCGIAGVYRFNADSAPLQPILQEMASRLHHRGPDSNGSYLSANGRLGLVHTRLAIIDPAGGQQPLHDRRHHRVLVANGEVYNYRELRQQLPKNTAYQSQSDCELILHARQHFGTDYLHQLNGMYAFALWDEHTEALELVRDRLGIKPLYYLLRNDGFYFASEIKALRCLLPDARVHAPALAQFLQMNFTTGRHTMLHGIQRILPGERLRVQANGQQHSERYWRCEDQASANIGLPEAMERLDVLLPEIMEQHVRSDVPFALFLSSGVDSSLLRALLHRHTDQAIHSYTLGFTSPGANSECALASELAQGFPGSHHNLYASAEDLWAQLPHAVWAADDLMGDYANLATLLLAKAASGQHKVVFSGEGGDEVFAGYGRYRIPRLKRWLKQLRCPGSGGFRSRGMAQRAHLEKGMNTALQQANHYWRDSIHALWQSAPQHWSRLQRMQSVDLQSWLPDDLLVKADRMLMQHGIEGRVPFLDHRLVAFGLSLPDALKIQGKQGKWLLKHWARPYLPANCLQRRKQGFTVPLRALLPPQRCQHLAQTLPESPAMQAWFEPAVLRRWLSRPAAQIDPSQLFALLQFACWHHWMIEGQPRTSLPGWFQT